MKRRTFLKGIGTASSTLSFIGCSIPTSKNKYSNYKPKGEIPRRTLGKAGIQVSLLSFGSHLKKELIAKPKLRDRMIKLGFEGGINLFDVYDHGGYKQFKPMGKSLRGFRKEVVISLCAVQTKDDKVMQEEINGALSNFYTDYIDLYRLYTVNDDTVNMLDKNKKAGKIRAIGVVSHDTKTMMGYIDNYVDTLDFVMIVYNFHNNKGSFGENYPTNDYSALIPRCKHLNLGILGIKPMGSDGMIELAREKRFFRDKKANIAQAMLRHVYQTEEIHSTMPAMNSMEEVITNLESAYNPSIFPYEKKVLSDLSKVAFSTKGAYLPPHYRWLENWVVKMA